ncbi:MAG: hypothetical protein ACE5FE_04395, partial [Acidiferrobacterales bacterium]
MRHGGILPKARQEPKVPRHLTQQDTGRQSQQPEAIAPTPAQDAVVGDEELGEPETRRQRPELDRRGAAKRMKPAACGAHAIQLLP